MRRKSTFLLTILPAETSEGELHGNLRTVADGSQATFSNLDELFALIHKTVTEKDETPAKKRTPVRSIPTQAS
ncbi:hypothetical protein LARV_02060 [Longilinea arvoryzae]|uniref:Uncharacterized protein n=1 Tax=Longilinea arvoryzae TaxID=360412 RepID=A0A0S7BIJ5_9CHLR|nr:hypothetical protein LARV_02060 [Longilinea arvoryzae]